MNINMSKVQSKEEIDRAIVSFLLRRIDLTMCLDDLKRCKDL